MSNEIETELEEIVAKMAGELTSPDNSSHLEWCATTLRELQLKVLRDVADTLEQLPHMMDDAPEDDFKRVAFSLRRLTIVIGGWDNYVDRLIDNGFNFAETPYRKASRS